MINLIGPINQLGYGIATLNILKELSKITSVSFWPISQPQVTNKEDLQTIQYCIQNAIMPDFNAPCIRIWHQHDMSQFVGRGIKIGMPIFELDEFNKTEKHHLSSLDKIFVCSSWAKDIILSNITIDNSNVSVIPLGVDSTIFRSKENTNMEKTIFFNCGKWEIRKGHDILSECFNKAFENDDNVELWMMCENPFLSKEEDQSWRNIYLNSKLGSKIKIIPRVETQQEVYNIMSKTDCGVFPARAEGWNLELLEMLSCGKHVITTDYSAHQEFCNNNNSFLIPVDDKEKAYDGKWFHGQGSWAKIEQKQKDCLTEYMRNFHKKKLNNEISTNLDGIKTAEKFTWNNSAKEILKYAI
jgi:glycosyltransferase involved in cell wall biosynthesis